MEILSIEFAQEIILKKMKLEEQERLKKGRKADVNSQKWQEQANQKATDEVFRQFVEEEKLNLLPKKLLNSQWIQKIKTGREYPLFGYEQSKTIVKVDAPDFGIA